MSEKLKSETNKILFLLATSELAHSFLYVTYSIFLVSRGVSLKEIALLCLVCSVAALLFDIPTGAFADVIGRKKAYIISAIIWMLCSVVYITSKSFWGFALAEILAALAMSLANGCVSAHLWDTVTAIGKDLGHTECEIETHNKTLSAKVIWVTSPVSALGGFVGAKLLEVNSSIPWIATGVGMILVIIFTMLFMKETKTRKKISFLKDVKEMTQNTVQAFKILLKKHEIRNIASIRALLRVSSVPIFLYWTPYLKESGASITVIGISWILMEIAMSLGVYLCRKAPESISVQKMISFLIMIIGLSAILGSYAKSYFVVLTAILFIEAANMALGYLFVNQTQKEITELGYGEAGKESNMRATLLSAVSTTITLGGIVGEIGAGQSVSKVGISGSWLLAGLLVISVALATYLLNVKKQKQIALQTEGAV